MMIKHKSDIDNNLSKIILDTIINLKMCHPEYLRSDASVSTIFIKDVDKAWNSVSGTNLSDLAMTDSDAVEIYRRLPEEYISQPLNPDTIHLIYDIYNDISFHRFFAADADSNCVEHWQFNNRANTRRHLGRPLEALEDHNRACDLEPECAMYFLNRATTLLELGMTKLALRDAIEAHNNIEHREFGSRDDFLTLDDILMLAGVMNSCGRKDVAVKALLKFTILLEKYMPFLSQVDGDGFCYMTLDKQSAQINMAHVINHAFTVFRAIYRGRLNSQIAKSLTDALLKLMDLNRKIGFVKTPL